MTERIPRISIFLSVKNFDISPSEISKVIDIVPDVSLSAGDYTRSGRVSDTSFWSVQLFSGHGWSVHEALVDALGKYSLDLFKSLTLDQKASAYLSVTVSFLKPPSIYLPLSMMIRLSELNVDFDIELFRSEEVDL